MLKNILKHFRKEHEPPLDWDNPKRAVRIGWNQTIKLNDTLAQMMSIASYSEGIEAEHIAQVQISPFARSTDGRGNVQITRSLGGVRFRGTTVLKDRVQFVSPRDVSRLTSEIMKMTDKPTRLSFLASQIPQKEIIRHVTEDALAMIVAGSIAGQMGKDADENAIIRKQRAILFEYRKRKDAQYTTSPENN